ncbi:MAG: bis(5'-nucleosyl)-tetraphosphatase (symmetrical) YqeK [Firmicutes bacterium]|nr:bis(5'-nucleosyl)-tetraphosphatase (symmetrical) YqeK [Bacillota bacterium]MCL5038611.1 bis(5'-nucleosyl)-tetraphosphatase (symmetrical) YqeK [Bacillota bacterium]
MTREVITRRVRQALSDKRWRHSQKVAEVAVALAKRYHLDEEKASLAGILHDFAKEIDDGLMLKLAAEFNIINNMVERDHPNILHGPVAAAMVQETFDVGDQEVIAAIAHHTTGAAGMTDLEKIIFLADFIEPTRNFPGVDKLRRLAEESLEQAVLAGLEHTFIYLLRRGLAIHPSGIEAWNDLRRRGAAFPDPRGNSPWIP